MIFSRFKEEKPVKYPCRKCAYYGACGDGGRTKPCEDRKTLKQYREERLGWPYGERKEN